MTAAARSGLRTLRRLGLAVWLSLALHAAVLGIVQLAPRSGPPAGQWLEARLELAPRSTGQPKARPPTRVANTLPQRLPRAPVRAAAPPASSDGGPVQSTPAALAPALAVPGEGVPAWAAASGELPAQVATFRGEPVRPAPLQSAPVAAAPVAAASVAAASVAPEPVQARPLQSASTSGGSLGRALASRPNNPEATTREPVPAVDLPLLTEARYYAAKELDLPPKPLHKIEPAYPREYERRGLTGEVLLEVRVETTGQVSGLRVIEITPAGYDAFEREALAALRAARFIPARRDGEAVRALVHVRVIFEPAD